jgi:hypothetical protein
VPVVTPTETPHPTRRLIDSAELKVMLNSKRTTFNKVIKQPEFPLAIELIDEGDYLWYLDEVETYIETRRHRPGPRPARTAVRTVEDKPPTLPPDQRRRRARPDDEGVDPDATVEVAFRPRTNRRRAA